MAVSYRLSVTTAIPQPHATARDDQSTTNRLTNEYSGLQYQVRHQGLVFSASCAQWCSMTCLVAHRRAYMRYFGVPGTLTLSATTIRRAVAV